MFFHLLLLLLEGRGSSHKFKIDKNVSVFYFNFLIVHMRIEVNCIPMIVHIHIVEGYVHISVGVCKDQKKSLNLLEVIVKHLVWVLETKLGSSAIAASSFI